MKMKGRTAQPSARSQRAPGRPTNLIAFSGTLPVNDGIATPRAIPETAAIWALVNSIMIAYGLSDSCRLPSYAGPSLNK